MRLKKILLMTSSLCLVTAFQAFGAEPVFQLGSQLRCSVSIHQQSAMGAEDRVLDEIGSTCTVEKALMNDWTGTYSLHAACAYRGGTPGYELLLQAPMTAEGAAAPGMLYGVLRMWPTVLSWQQHPVVMSPKDFASKGVTVKALGMVSGYPTATSMTVSCSLVQ